MTTGNGSGWGTRSRSGKQDMMEVSIVNVETFPALFSHSVPGMPGAGQFSPVRSWRDPSHRI